MKENLTNENIKKVVIVGGGASGLLASIVIKRALGKMVDVIILERLEKIGKKILASGNGRCNFTNELMCDSKFNNSDFVYHLFKRFGYSETVSFFEELGLMSKVLTEGRTYPVTENASSVLDVLRLELEYLGVKVRTGFEVKKITAVEKQYLLTSLKEDEILADYVIMSTGGKSSPVLGSNGSGYDILKPHDIKINKTLPGLVGLKVDKNLYKSLDGIRVKGKLSIKDKKNGQVYWTEDGEVLFKSDGLSGIVSMQASSYLNRIGKNISSYIVSLDMLSNMKSEEIYRYLDKKMVMYPEYSLDYLLTGLINRLLAFRILKDNKIELTRLIKTLTNKEKDKIVNSIKNYNLDVKSTYDFDKAQVTIGGVDVNEVKKETLELKKLKNVYVIGELLDIDGECGGYNLQWAWTSGYIAGCDIVKKISKG